MTRIIILAAKWGNKNNTIHLMFHKMGLRMFFLASTKTQIRWIAFQAQETFSYNNNVN